MQTYIAIKMRDNFSHRIGRRLVIGNCRISRLNYCYKFLLVQTLVPQIGQTLLEGAICSCDSKYEIDYIFHQFRCFLIFLCLKFYFSSPFSLSIHSMLLVPFSLIPVVTPASTKFEVFPFFFFFFFSRRTH